MIQDLTEFERLLKICRKQGVTELKVGEVSVSFGEAPKKARSKDDDADETDIPTEGLSPEQLMFYSAGGQ